MWSPCDPPPPSPPIARQVIGLPEQPPPPLWTHSTPWGMHIHRVSGRWFSRGVATQLVVAECQYHKSANLNGRTDPEPAFHGRTSKMSAFYTKVGTLLKSRHPFKSLKNWQSTSLQPGTTSKNSKSKKCLEFPSAPDHQPFWRSVIGPENSWK
jgi:hypothetical protein